MAQEKELYSPLFPKPIIIISFIIILFIIILFMIILFIMSIERTPLRKYINVCYYLIVVYY